MSPLTRGQVGRQRGGMLPVRHRWRRRPVDAVTRPWVSSLACFDPMGAPNWEFFRKRIRNWFYPDNVYAASSAPLPFKNGSRFIAEHLGYAFEWHYKGFSTSLQHGGMLPPVRLSTVMRGADVSTFADHQGVSQLNAPSDVTPLSWLMTHYGRPVQKRNKEFGDGGPGQVRYDHGGVSDKSDRSYRENAWTAQVASAAEMICGFSGATPGDFLHGMLPADHWTRPRKITGIAIRTGMAADGYWGVTLPEDLWRIGSGDFWHHVWPFWSVAGNFTNFRGDASINKVLAWAKHFFGPAQDLSRLDGEPMYFKYEVFLAGQNITAVPLASQSWIAPHGVAEIGNRHVLDVVLPSGDYSPAEIDVRLYFKEDTSRNIGNDPRAVMTWGHTGWGQFNWPSIDVQYELENPLETVPQVGIDPAELGVTGYTFSECALAPLSGRLMVRQPELWEGATGTSGRTGSADYTVPMLTGYFPSGSDHVAAPVTVAEGSVQNADRSSFVTHCNHTGASAVDIPAFGHWHGGASQNFTEILQSADVMEANPYGGRSVDSDAATSADWFVPGGSGNSLTVTAE